MKTKLSATRAQTITEPVISRSLKSLRFSKSLAKSPEIKIGKCNITKEKSFSWIISASNFREEVSIMHDSAGLETFRPVLKVLKTMIKDSLPTDLSARSTKALSKDCGDQLGYWNNSNVGIVLRELLVNSQRAIEGKVDGKIEISASLKDSVLEIQIKDNGSGLPAKADKLFQKGFSTKSTFNVKAGLCGNGLYRSKEFLEKILGGSIELINRKDSSLKETGAIATIKIPV